MAVLQSTAVALRLGKKHMQWHAETTKLMHELCKGAGCQWLICGVFHLQDHQTTPSP
jgi:UDP-2,3-diacylglucosamine pyrophosphatase LpxH